MIPGPRQEGRSALTNRLQVADRIAAAFLALLLFSGASCRAIPTPSQALKPVQTQEEQREAKGLRSAPKSLKAPATPQPVETRAMQATAGSAEGAAGDDPRLDVLTADLEGDGKVDRIVAPKARGNAPKDAPAIRVESASGQVILDLAADGPPYTGVALADVGAPTKALIARKSGGSGGEGLEAYVYDPSQGRMVRLNWGDKKFEFGFLTVNQEERSIAVGHKMYDYAGHVQYTSYSFRGARLEPTRMWYEGPTDDESYPQSRTMVLLAALTSLSLRLGDETPRYFADAGYGKRVYQEWANLTPMDGTFTVDENRAVAEPFPGEGAETPFKVWAFSVGPVRRAAGFTGEVAFKRESGKFKISVLRMESIDLKVPTAAEALTIAGSTPSRANRALTAQKTEKQGAAAPASVSLPGFENGSWVIEVTVPGASGNSRAAFHVDAETGQVTRDP